MACFESGTVISLAGREAITLPDIGGATLRVTQGTLWLTEGARRQDVVLRPATTGSSNRDGDTVVERRTTPCSASSDGRAPARSARAGESRMPACCRRSLLRSSRQRDHVPYA